VAENLSGLEVHGNEAIKGPDTDLITPGAARSWYSCFGAASGLVRYYHHGDRRPRCKGHDWLDWMEVG